MCIQLYVPSAVIWTSVLTMHKSQIHASPVLFKWTWYSQLLTLPKSSIILTCNSAFASDFGNMSIYWYLFLFGISCSYYICFRCLYVCLYGMQAVAYYLLISSLFTALLHHTWDEDIQICRVNIGYGVNVILTRLMLKALLFTFPDFVLTWAYIICQ